MIHTLLLAIIIFNVAQNASAMDRHQRQTLLKKFLPEIEEEKNIFNDALNLLETLLLQMPIENNNASLIKIVEERISRTMTHINLLSLETNYCYKTLTSKELSKIQRRDVLQILIHKLTELQTHTVTMQKWEAVFKILNRHFHHNIQKIAIAEQALLAEQESLSAQFCSLTLHRPSSERTPMNISDESKETNMQPFLRWLEDDINKKREEIRSMPKIHYASAYVRPGDPKPTERFIG